MFSGRGVSTFIGSPDFVSMILSIEWNSALSGGGGGHQALFPPGLGGFGFSRYDGWYTDRGGVSPGRGFTGRLQEFHHLHFLFFQKACFEPQHTSPTEIFP